MQHVKDGQDSQHLDPGSTVPEEETLDLVQVASNHPVQEILPDTITNPKKKGMFLLIVF